jgi:hypothetical protein
MSFVRRLVLGQNLRLTFSSKEKFLNELLPQITKWKKEKFTFSTFDSCNVHCIFGCQGEVFIHFFLLFISQMTSGSFVM